MKILVAVDGSPDSLHALEYAIRLAARISEPTHLLLANAHDDVALRSASQFVARESVDTYLREQSESELRQAIELAKNSGVSYEVRMLRGNVGIVLSEAAESEGCDMLVLGSKGHTALKDLLLGSVAQRVVSLSKVPVLLVK